MSLVLSALFAGLVAIGVTVAIERWGGRAGGLIGTLPSTIVPAALGIWAASDVDAFRAAMYATPPGMLLNAGFLWLWRVVPPRLPAIGLAARLALMVAISLAMWACAATGVVLALGAGRATLVVAAVTTFAIAAAGALALVGAPSAPRGRRRVGPVTLLSRGVLAAAAIGAAVAIARAGGPVAAGVAAVFPSIFVTTMVSLWLSQGEAVPVGAVGPMMLGSTSVAAYALFAAALFPRAGPLVGAPLAWFAAALLVTLPLGFLVRARARVA